jgi:hypothetical protein
MNAPVVVGVDGSARGLTARPDQGQCRGEEPPCSVVNE